MKFFTGGLRRLVILGINDYAVEAARICLEAGIDVKVVSAPRFRNLPVMFPAAGTPDTCDGRIAALGLEIVELERLSPDTLAPWKMADWAAFSFDSPFIIKRDVIELFGGLVFNEHGANLPQGRGGGGFTWRILEGDRQGRVVFHRLVERVDAGAIVHSRGFLFGPECRKPIDYMRVQARQTEDDLRLFLARLAANDDFRVVEQDERLATYFPRLSTADQALIDWSWSVSDIERFVLGFSDPYPGARTWVNGVTCVIRDASAIPARFDAHPFKRGIVYNIVDGNLFVCGSDGTLVVTEYALQTDGARITVGDRLFTPGDNLTASLSRRAIYGPNGLSWKGGA